MAAEDLIPALQTAVGTFNSAVDTKQAVIDGKVASATTAQTNAKTEYDKAVAARDTAKLSLDAAYRDLQSARANTSYQDLSALSTSKTDTAVDVFIYDTSKDSDGGAWRKRCTKTSWYNETLNTATRGSRREFPSVALIVGETNEVTIYDADDPSLPMWKVIPRLSATTYEGFWYSSQNLRAIHAGQGKILLAMGTGSSASGMRILDFAADIIYRYTGSVSVGSTYYTGILGNIVDGINGVCRAAGLTAIVNSNVNDFALTVLPDAPIDPITGLAVPTIAVATDGGVSVIKDNAGVVNLLTSNGGMGKVDFTDDDGIVIAGGGGVAYAVWKFNTIPSANSNTASFILGSGSTPSVGAPGNQIGYSANLHRNNTWYIDQKTGKRGLIALFEDRQDVSKSLFNLWMPSYITGWLPGNIKGAFLCDTDATDLVESGELVANGTFETDAGWTVGNGWTIADGVANINNPSGLSGDLSASLPTTVGKFYVVSFTTSGSGNFRMLGPTFADVGAGSHYRSFTAIASTSLSFRTQYGAVGTLDNISVKLADADRSVKNNPLIINGTITRSPVATGAELVAYSGWSASNYLRQLYSSNMDFGTGDWCISAWLKDSANGEIVYASSNLYSTSVPYTFENASGSSLSFDVTTQTATVTASQPGGGYPFLRFNMAGIISQSKVYEFEMQLSASTGVNMAAIDLWPGWNTGTTKVNSSGYVKFIARFTQDSLYLRLGSLGTHPYTVTIDSLSVREVAPNTLISRSAATGAKIEIGANPFGFNTNKYIEVLADDGTSSRTVVSGTTLRNGVWRKIDAVYTSDGALKLYADGVLVSTSTGTALGSLNNSNAVLTIGNNYALDAPFPGSLALVRLSATAPTADQIRKMYEDERHLFTDNAACTLYGSSDSVIGVAYDTDTDLLHVGTSQGRSVFKGLRRVDNTTTAVGAAISAVNGMVVDE